MIKRFITKGKGKSRKVIPLNDGGAGAKVPAKRSVKAEDYTDYKTSKRYLENKLSDEGGDLLGNHWSIGRTFTGIKLTLGNMTTAGWYWVGEAKDMAGFLVRIIGSRVRKEFIETMRRNNVDFRKVKGVMLKSISEGDGLYEMTGDTLRWKFGTTMPEVDEDTDFDDFAQDRDVTLTDEFKDEVRDRYYPDMPDYDHVKKRYMARYKEEMREAVMDSGSFEEFTGKVADIQKSFDYDIIEDLSETMGAGFRSVMFAVAKERNM
ncbi:hypothetical protein GQ472_01680 [archaeon]|nr:hypothetical protein [archaeon]